MGKLKVPQAAIDQDLLMAAYSAAGELTRTFFRAVENDAPVENGHLHQTFGTALKLADLPETEDVVSQLLAKGSGDPEAIQRGYGSTTQSANGVRVVVGTNVGFVQKLNDGDLIEAGVNGNSGWKVNGQADEGVLYGPRKADGPLGFLMWFTPSGQFFSRMHSWGPLGFFESAEMALEQQAREMGLK